MYEQEMVFMGGPLHRQLINVKSDNEIKDTLEITMEGEVVARYRKSEDNGGVWVMEVVDE